MSEKLTRLELPGQKNFPGLLEYGVQEVDAMIDKVRSYSRHLRAQADAIDAASDDDFMIDIVRGPVAQHHICNLQKGIVRK